MHAPLHWQAIMLMHDTSMRSCKHRPHRMHSVRAWWRPCQLPSLRHTRSSSWHAWPHSALHPSMCLASCSSSCARCDCGSLQLAILAGVFMSAELKPTFNEVSYHLGRLLAYSVLAFCDKLPSSPEKGALVQMLERLDLSSAAVETVLLACAPQQHSGQQALVSCCIPTPASPLPSNLCKGVLAKYHRMPLPGAKADGLYVCADRWRPHGVRLAAGQIHVRWEADAGSSATFDKGPLQARDGAGHCSGEVKCLAQNA